MGPAGSSGTGTGSTANVYTPTAQPQADTSYQSIINSLLGQIGPSGAGSPAGQLFPGAQNSFNWFANPSLPGSFGNAAGNQALTGAQVGAGLGGAGGPALQNAGMGILQTGFDPQNALFRQQQGLVADQSNVANSMAGVGGTPYGASTTANALGNFDLNWQNNLLKRQGLAGTAAEPLLQAAPTLAASSAALPFQTGVGINQAGLTGAQGLAQLGNNQFAIPQALLNDLQSYLNLGQSASGISGTLGNMGVNQTGNMIGGALSGLSSLFGGGGSGGLLGGIGSLFGGLF